MKILHSIAKVLLSLILILPSFGLFGIFPAPTRDLYATDQAFAFIQLIMQSANYIDYMMVAVLLVALASLWTKREALAALLITPITANVVVFHLFLDGGLFSVGSLPALIMLITNVYFLFKNKSEYMQLLRGSVK